MLRPITVCAALICTMPGTIVQAQEYPNKPITIVVQFPEKTLGDTMARLVAERLQAALGQPVNVKNVPGKTGSVAVEEVAKAAPDGYTLSFAGDGPLTTAAVLYETLGYDPRRDLAPIAKLIATQNALVVSAAAPARSIADLVKAAKEKPGQSYAHTGTGFSTHLAGELLKKQHGIDLKPVELAVPADFYKAVEAGQVLFGVTSVGLAAPQVKEGKARAIAVTGPQRASLLPETATLTELGFTSGHDPSAWFALLAPKGTPQPIIAKLHAEATKMIVAPDVSGRLTALGARPDPSTSAELGKRIETTIATLTDLLKDVPKQK
jgi:tripartite-type tricarboxylate transporter receptor subunit TctC